MKTIKTLALALLALVGVTTAANAATAYLATDDFTGITFWLISMGMLAATAFFFYRAVQCFCGLEKIGNGSRISNWYSIYPLHVLEISMG